MTPQSLKPTEALVLSSPPKKSWGHLAAPDPKKRVLEAHLLAEYGLTWQEYEGLYDKQRGSCAICGILQDDLKQRLAVDHDHKTGEVRGLLCFRCNLMLGAFEKMKERGLLYQTEEYLLWNQSTRPSRRTNLSG